MDPAPPFGLLLDVDGPLASIVTRRISTPSIVTDLVSLANAGVPVVFNTGRSDAFIRDHVVKPLLVAGLLPAARVYGVCEKGAVWFAATAEHFDGVHVDEAVAVPPVLVDAVRELVETRYRDDVDWDSTKRAMISMEQSTTVSAFHYRGMRDRLDDELFDLLVGFDLGVVLGDRRHGETVTFRIDQTPISTDIEAVTLGKDLGAERALAMLERSEPVPTVWRTAGDSRSDYAMADYLHSLGHEVEHLDVRPAHGVPEVPYPVLTEGDLVDDAAGAAFLARLAAGIR